MHRERRIMRIRASRRSSVELRTTEDASRNGEMMNSQTNRFMYDRDLALPFGSVCVAHGLISSIVSLGIILASSAWPNETTRARYVYMRVYMPARDFFSASRAD